MLRAVFKKVKLGKGTDQATTKKMYHLGGGGGLRAGDVGPQFVILNYFSLYAIAFMIHSTDVY